MIIREGSVIKLSVGECHEFLPYLHRPHVSGAIQWARGDVGLKLPAAARPVMLCAGALPLRAHATHVNESCHTNR